MTVKIISAVVFLCAVIRVGCKSQNPKKTVSYDRDEKEGLNHLHQADKISEGTSHSQPTALLDH
jgi:hypothetical protein